MSMYTSEHKAAPADPSIASLLSGVVNDVQRLLKQHMELFRHEIREDINKTKRGVVAFAVAGVLALIGAAFLLTFLIGLLAWAVPAIPWWGWAGILGAVAAMSALGLVMAGKKSITSIGVDQTAAEIKEDIQWLKK